MKFKYGERDNWLQIMKTAAQEAEAGLKGQDHL